MTWALKANAGLGRGVATAVTSGPARALLLIATVAATAAGIFATAPVDVAQAVMSAGSDLTRLLRFMALLKTMMALAALAAVLWRLGAAVTPIRLAAYAVAAAAMAAGPGLIWGMVHLKLGAALLHGGLIATIVLLWRDPAVGARLETIIRARRLQ